MPAVTEVGQYKQEEKDPLEKWLDEVGISMSDVADRILQEFEDSLNRRAARRTALASEAIADNVVSIFAAR
ncbi:MAG: hypothetical protein JWP42_3999 [Pseudomonas sp.]|nr:hypothetical protein [Pseudomonas sp.]